MEEQECCPRLDPLLWQDKQLNWKDKRFIKTSVATFFNIPLNFGSKMKMLSRLVENAEAKMPDSLCMSDHASGWKMDIYLAVDKEIPNIENVTMSGKYFSRVYEGQFSDTAQWCNDFAQKTREKGISIKKEYMWYTTCPKCAKKYGKNYVVILGLLQDQEMFL